MGMQGQQRWLWHADWGLDPDKRWVTAIQQRDDGTGIIQQPQPFQQYSDWLFANDFAASPVLIGVDFPIGLPVDYAKAVNITDFKAFLAGKQGPDWAEFSAVADRLSEVSLSRPFYPRARVNADDKAEMPPQQAWLRKLGLAKPQTYRQCDLATDDRKSAASLFWTVGANQVGKAALAGWRDLVRPLLGDQPERVGLWPFDGDLPDLLAEKPIVLAETYPGEIYSWFDCKPTSKTKRESRRGVMAKLNRAIADLGLTITDEAAAMLADGFGDDRHGEDRFDSFVGALGLYAIVSDKRSTPVPDDPIFRTVEGWILGQALPG